MAAATAATERLINHPRTPRVSMSGAMTDAMMPSARLFRSRWAALIWAAGIVWTAVDVADSAPRSAPAANASAPASAKNDGGDTPDPATPDAATAAAVEKLLTS